MAGDRGKMSSFPDPLELEQLDGTEEEDPSVFDRVTAVPGEVPDAALARPPAADDPVSGLHQRTEDDASPSFREPFADDDLPPVLGRPAESTRLPARSAKPEEPSGAAPGAASQKGADPWKETGKRRVYGAKRPVLELELDDIEPRPAPAPGSPSDALEAPLPEPESRRVTAPLREPLPASPTPVHEPSPVPFALSRPAPESPPRAALGPASAPQPSPEVLGMRDRYATGDFTGALVVARALLERTPDHEEARRCQERCTEVLSQMYFARLGSPAQAVRVAVPNDQIRWLSLDHRAGFLLSLVDGHSTIEELLDISGMPRLDALRILYELLDQRVIALAERR
ncbi:MAG TPA: hypothetical protein VFZ53_13965 [Polyangiaceae bacterium]